MSTQVIEEASPRRTAASPSSSAAPAARPEARSGSALGRALVFAYGLVCYAAFFGTILYAIGFVAEVLVPKSMNTGTPGALSTAILVNVGILGLFAIQHTIMARPGFKKAWTRIIPAAAERSTFVLVTCGILSLLFWQWRPLPESVWHIDNSVGRWAMYTLSATGWLTVFLSSFLIDHFDLFGLRQVVTNLKGQDYTHKPFATRGLYKLVRHPLLLGFLVAFWFTPHMTQGHLMFAVVTTAYIMVGSRIEERDLVKAFGDDYRQYRKRTPALLPLGKRGSANRQSRMR